MEYQLFKTRMDLFIVKIDYIWARTAAVSGIQSHILKIAVHYLYFTAIAAIEKAEMNDTRGYGSEKKSFTVFLNRWTKALNVRIQSSEKKWGKISRNFIATIVARFSLLLAMMSTLSRRHILPFQQGRINFHVYIHFLFHAYRYLSIWDFAPHESALFQ